MPIQPSSLDWKLAKWIIIPVALFIGGSFLVNYVGSNNRCQKLAEERGYIEGEYLPPNRVGFGARCICRGRRNADGTVDRNAKLVIPLD